jgi:Zn ribbon nucleic-acid-binding protein
MLHFDCPWCAGEASLAIEDQVDTAHCVECAMTLDLVDDPASEAVTMAA